MTETAVENEVVENAENVEPEVEAVPVLASLDEADPATRATVPILVPAINTLNEVRTRNSGKTKGLDEIVADLKESSQNPKVVALREKAAQISEQIAALVTDEAKAIKENAGEPDLEAEKNAKAAVDGLLKALHTFPDGKRVDHFLPAIVGGTTRIGAASNSGPKNDMSAVRDWARKNGFADVKDRGRLSEEILDAYNKANAK